MSITIRGNIAGLLQPCSPVRYRGQDGRGGVVDQIHREQGTADVYIDGVLLENEPLDRLFLDLSGPPTGPAHAAAWVYAQVVNESGGEVELTSDEVDLAINAALCCALTGAQIDALAELVLRLAKVRA